MTIDLSQYKIGQRFRTQGGYEAVLDGVLPPALFGMGRRFAVTVSLKEHGRPRLFLEYRADGTPVGLFDGKYKIEKPLFGRPARTRRLPKPSPMPTGYERQWPHLYQMGGRQAT